MKNEARYAAFLVLTSSPPAGRPINTQAGAGYQSTKTQFYKFGHHLDMCRFWLSSLSDRGGESSKKSVDLKKTSKEKSVMNNEEL